ncbi:MAG: hypothetical protein NTZ33_02240 [Bacteroidetes bacterium]|nr:hypothetical protein [Bacteroidota bacterium]
MLSESIRIMRLLYLCCHGGTASCGSYFHAIGENPHQAVRIFLNAYNEFGGLMLMT